MTEKTRSKYALPKKKPVISEENALQSLMKLLVRNNVDIEKVDEERRGAVENCIDRVLEGIMLGHVEILEENGQIKVKQHIQNKSENGIADHLVYGEVTGDAHINMIHHEDNPVATSLSLLAKICETQRADIYIKQLRSSDLAMAEAISTLFL